MSILGLLEFQSTRPVRGATRATGKTYGSLLISIHAPRAGRDRLPNILITSSNDFNPRAPCGARLPGFERLMERLGFQSTRPVRGATAIEAIIKRGNDAFQSTRPVRGATHPRFLALCKSGISIHAPRAGRDGGQKWLRSTLTDFNPRAPCGARPQTPADQSSLAVFQSTRPVRGATPTAPVGSMHGTFQSTRPVRGATTSTYSDAATLKFQSTRPVRGATRDAVG